jgi:hypothetical protein
MISQFFIVSPRGDTLIFKDYRGDVPRTTSETFWRKVKFSQGEAPPVFVRPPPAPACREGAHASGCTSRARRRRRHAWGVGGAGEEVLFRVRASAESNESCRVCAVR